MDFIKKIITSIFHRKKRSVNSSDRPAAWEKTTTDLYNEMHSGKTSSIPQKELEWAEDYQRSLISSKYKFPKKGYVYEYLEDQNVEIEIWYLAPGLMTLYFLREKKYGFIMIQKKNRLRYVLYHWIMICLNQEWFQKTSGNFHFILVSA